MDIFYYPPQVSLFTAAPLKAVWEEMSSSDERRRHRFKNKSLDWRNANHSHWHQSWVSLLKQVLGQWPAPSRRKAWVPVARWWIRTPPLDRCCWSGALPRIPMEPRWQADGVGITLRLLSYFMFCYCFQFHHALFICFGFLFSVFPQLCVCVYGVCVSPPPLYFELLSSSYLPLLFYDNI